MKKKQLVYGVGINDLDYQVQIKIELPKVDGKRKQKVLWTCPYYHKWKEMLKRCYSPKSLSKRPTYTFCEVCDEWLTASKFRAWMQVQDWEGKHLDKDLLGNGKLYSPSTCLFVDPRVNTFMLDCGAVRGEYPTGVSWRKDINKFTARCNNIISECELLGQFSCPLDAHAAWLKRKLEVANELADMQSDKRVAEALRSYYKQKELSSYIVGGLDSNLEDLEFDL